MEEWRFFEANRNKVIEKMPANSCAIFFAASPKYRSGDTQYPYCQNKNFYYLTGLNIPNSVLAIKKSESGSNCYLFTEQISEQAAHWFGPRPSIEDIKELTHIDGCYSYQLFYPTLHRILTNTTTCILDFKPIALNEPITQELFLVKNIRDHYPYIKIRPAYHLMAPIREIKETWEIDRIRSAIDITKRGFFSVLKHASPGMTEFEIEAYFTFELHRLGMPTAFQPIIACGNNATTLHHETDETPLEENTLVLLDFGAEFLHYSADISRVFPVNGVFSEQQRQIYEIVLEANVQTINAVKPGLTLTQLNTLCSDVLAAGLMQTGIMKEKNEISNYFTHSVSHQLGLNTHDISKHTNFTLKPGMVITIEPGLYLPSMQMGIRIEDDILVTEDGHENLSADIPKSIDAVENLWRELRQPGV